MFWDMVIIPHCFRWCYLFTVVDDGIQDSRDTLCKDSIQWSDIGNGMALEEDGKNTRQKKKFIKE